MTQARATDPDVRLIHADCLDAMRALEAASVDAVVCDPPYGLAFMDKGWDHGVPDVTYWAEALRVAKPGAHLVAFGGTRTYHRLACAIEDAGWEVRDCLSWLYGSGFPKSLDVSKAIDKAAGAERSIVTGTRGLKPWSESAAAGVAIKDDGGLRQDFDKVNTLLAPATDAARAWQGWGTSLKPAWEPIILARKSLVGTVAANVLAHGTGGLNIDAARIGERWPANVALDEEAAAMLGAQSRYFYCAKASRSERDRGCEALEPRPQDASRDKDAPGGNNPYNNGAKPRPNSHPTVKPLDLMRWLVRLVCPPHGTVLDPFVGSGTTLLAARAEGFDSIGIEREAEYVEIACARLGLDGAGADLSSRDAHE